MCVERVELTAERVWLHARAVSNTRTEELTADFWTASRVWREVVGDLGWNAAGEPPAEPGLMLQQVDVMLSDAKSRPVPGRTVSVGGTGTEWVISWSWPFQAGDELAFLASSPDGRSTTLCVNIRS